jgi:hypothetical protein
MTVSNTYRSFINALRARNGLPPLFPHRAQSDNGFEPSDDNDGLTTLDDPDEAAEFIRRSYRWANGEDDDDEQSEAKAKVRHRRIAAGQPLRAGATTQEVAAFITEHYRRAKGDQP